MIAVQLSVNGEQRRFGFADAPKIECVLLDQKGIGSVEAGETPAIAVAHATRLRI